MLVRVIQLTNKEYFDSLEGRLKRLEDLRKEGIVIGAGIIGESLCPDDFFFVAALNRGIAMLDGMVMLLNERNLACAGIVARVRLDNCMRIYAAFIAEDRDAFIDGFIRGEKASSFKDNRGKKMRDCELVDRLAEYDPLFKRVYEKSSGYVHLSETAFYSIVSAKEPYHIEFTIGTPVKEELNTVLLEIADAFIYYTSFEYRLLKAVVASKERLDAKLDAIDSEEN